MPHTSQFIGALQRERVRKVKAILLHPWTVAHPSSIPFAYIHAQKRKEEKKSWSSRVTKLTWLMYAYFVHTLHEILHALV